MPTTRTICYYAMYVIGEVETQWDWTGINYNDPITIGMMQWYGTRAAGLLNRVKDEMPSAYPTLAASLRTDLEAHSTDDRWWTTRYLNREEGNSIVTVFSEKENHVIQENQAIADFEGYISTLTSWGMSESAPKPLVFAMSMYHQNPSYCGEVLGTAGGSADLERIYTVCMNHHVLGQYATRYTTVKQRLENWDGESMPPDFGQSGGTTVTPGGNNPGITVAENKLSHIIKRGDCLFVYGKDEYAKGVAFVPCGTMKWLCAFNADGTPIEGGNTGGGTQTGSQALKDICELFKSWAGRFAYSQGAGRLDPVSSGYGDCSSTIWYAYQKVAGVDVGTWTGAMAERGNMIASGDKNDPLPIGEMQPADLVLITWSGYNPAFDHVELYVGDNVLWGHGGPGNGPVKTTDSASSYMQHTSHWEVRRYL